MDGEGEPPNSPWCAESHEASAIAIDQDDFYVAARLVILAKQPSFLLDALLGSTSDVLDKFARSRVLAAKLPVVTREAALPPVRPRSRAGSARTLPCWAAQGIAWVLPVDGGFGPFSGV